MTTRIDQHHPRPSAFQKKPDATRPDLERTKPGHTKPLSPDGITRGRVARGAAPDPAAPVRPTGPARPGEPSAKVTPEGLQDAFGSTNSNYDLNRDRVVNIDDMVHLILNMPSTNAADPAATESDPTAPGFDGSTLTPGGDASSVGGGATAADAPPTYDGFAEVWGQNDSAYDIVDNDVVDIDDLVRFVLDQTPPPAAAPTAPVTPLDTAGPDGVAPAANTNRPGDVALANSAPTTPDTPEPLTIEGLQAAWGQADTRYDLDRNGTVNIDDLVRFIMHGAPDAGGANPTAPTDVAAAAPETALPAPRVAPPDIAVANRVANSVIDRLRDAGFDSTLPTNLNELLDSLNLKDDQRGQIANRLGKAFPNGLGIDRVG